MTPRSRWVSWGCCCWAHGRPSRWRRRCGLRPPPPPRSPRDRAGWVVDRPHDRTSLVSDPPHRRPHQPDELGGRDLVGLVAGCARQHHPGRSVLGGRRGDWPPPLPARLTHQRNPDRGRRPSLVRHREGGLPPWTAEPQPTATLTRAVPPKTSGKPSRRTGRRPSTRAWAPPWDGLTARTADG
jgi:hypothetical protein